MKFKIYGKIKTKRLKNNICTIKSLFNFIYHKFYNKTNLKIII